MSEWKAIKVKEIIHPSKYSCVGGPFGSNLTSKDYIASAGVPVSRGNNLVLGSRYFIDDNFVFVSDEKAQSLIQNTAYPGDLILTQRGTIGQVALIPEKSKYSKYILSQNQMKLSVDPAKADIQFVCYYFLSSLAQEIIIKNSIGSTIPGFNLTQLRDFPINLPPLHEQKEISLILGSLDRKIENLRKQNETLEEIARSIFKHWFIDFEFPNADGKPYKSSGGVMVRSELGDIPEGWRVGKLEDVITVNPRESVKKGENIKFVDMKSLSTSSMEITDYIYKESASGSKFRNEDTLLARITPCLENGKTAFVSILEADEVAVGSTEFLVLRAKNNCCPEYVYALARNPYFRDFAIKNMTGSSGRQRIPTDIVLNYKLPIPNHQVMRHYKETCYSLFFKIGSNQKQIQTLTKTRDNLLPKLMSGQLRVKE